MIVLEAIALLEKEDPKAQVYVVHLGKSHAPRWSVVAGAMIQLKSPAVWRRLVGITRREGKAAFLQENEAQLANAER